MRCTASRSASVISVTPRWTPSRLSLEGEAFVAAGNSYEFARTPASCAAFNSATTSARLFVLGVACVSQPISLFTNVAPLLANAGALTDNANAARSRAFEVIFGTPCRGVDGWFAAPCSLLETRGAHHDEKCRDAPPTRS